MDSNRSSDSAYPASAQDSSFDQEYYSFGFHGNHVMPNNFIKESEHLATMMPKRRHEPTTGVTKEDQSEKRVTSPRIQEMLELKEKFSDSFSFIISKINCASGESREPEDALLKDEDFYWPSRDDDSITDAKNGTTNRSNRMMFEYREQFGVSESSLVPLVSTED